MIEEYFEYNTDFYRCRGFQFMTRHTDGRGHDTVCQYDTHGNRTQVQHRIPGIVEDFEYNGFGQMTAHVWPDNGSGHHQRDELTYYESGDGQQYGYRREVIGDAGGFNLTTTYEYNPVGRVVRRSDPRQHDTEFIVNQYDQVVRATSRAVELPPGKRQLGTLYARYLL
ncbi:MAG: hypothetical protein KAY37_03390 [Phycisphaerae bacterium]|nr:hypothetical protein [Phycisphaerae bacterium]